MHFSYKQDDGIFTIIAGFNEEHGDQRHAERVQGDKTKIELVEDRVAFGLDLKEIDPDHFALAACLIFLPFIGNKVSFSVPVSRGIVEFLSSPSVQKMKGGPVEVVANVETSNPDMGEISLSTCALALGGGFDAVAIKTLLPEVFSYHQLSAIAVNHVYHYPIYRFYSMRDQARFDGAPVCDAFVWSNVENIVRPRGVTTWATYTLPALLMARDKGINCILSGTVFEGSFCSNGIKYNEYNPNSRWNFIGRAFEAVGIKMVSAATMMPEYLNTRQVFASGLGDIVSSCIMSPLGGPCGKCMKCYRKRLLYEVNKREGGVKAQQFEAQEIGAFDTDFIRRKTSEWPMYLSSSFRWMWDLLPHDMFVPTLQKTIENIPDVRFGLDRVFTPGLALFPEPLQTIISGRIGRRYQDMTAAEIQAVREWDLTKLRPIPDAA